MINSTLFIWGLKNKQANKQMENESKKKSSEADIKMVVGLIYLHRATISF